MITSTRLLLRPYEARDAETYLNLLHHNSEHLADYFSNTIQANDSLESVIENFQAKARAWENDQIYSCGMFLKETGQLIGHMAVREIDWRVPKGEVAYFVFNEFNGKGYTSEGLAVFRDWCFTEKKFNRLYAKIDVQNVASMVVAEKCGFKKEGLLVKDYRRREKDLVDIYIYGYTI